MIFLYNNIFMFICTRENSKKFNISDKQNLAIYTS